jgi:hypothetical protein
MQPHGRWCRGVQEFNSDETEPPWPPESLTTEHSLDTVADQGHPVNSVIDETEHRSCVRNGEGERSPEIEMCHKLFTVSGPTSTDHLVAPRTGLAEGLFRRHRESFGPACQRDMADPVRSSSEDSVCVS